MPAIAAIPGIGDAAAAAKLEVKGSRLLKTLKGGDKITRYSERVFAHAAIPNIDDAAAKRRVCGTTKWPNPPEDLKDILGLIDAEAPKGRDSVSALDRFL